MSKVHPSHAWRAYRTPMLIALTSLIGLISALVGDGVFNVISWAALGAVPCVIVWALKYRRKRPRA